ncbi:unnamed protein product [Natator depressus]
MVLQALVDHRGHFTDINVGWLGKVHDTRIFRNSGLFKKLQYGTFFPNHRMNIDDIKRPIVILGDSAYPLLPWLMKPYTDHLDSSKEQFSYRLSKCRMVVECAFGCLKGRWRSLLTRLDLSEENIPMVIAACCVLHNICEKRGKIFRRSGQLRQITWQPFLSSQNQANKKSTARGAAYLRGFEKLFQY